MSKMTGASLKFAAMTVLLFLPSIVASVAFGLWTISSGLEARSSKLEAHCADHCFPFASKLEGPEEQCWCADLGDVWHPDTW